MDKKRKELMEQVRIRIAEELPNIKGCLYRANPFARNVDSELIFRAINKRVNKVSVRSAFVFMLYDCLEEHAQHTGTPFTPIPEEDLIRLAFLADVAMAIMYLHNQIYDGKGEVTDRTAISNNLGAANLLKDTLLEEYISSFPAPHAEFIKQQFRFAFNSVDTGQLIDTNLDFAAFYADDFPLDWLEEFEETHFNFVLHAVDEIEDDTSSSRPHPDIRTLLDWIENLKTAYPSSSHVIDTYITRIYLTNSCLLTALVDCAVRLTGMDKNDPFIEKLFSFAKLMGLVFQIVNDAADFVYDDQDTGNKVAGDVLSDLRNQTVSLPLIIHLNTPHIGSTTNYVKDWAKGSKALPTVEDAHDYILMEMMASHALPITQSKARELRLFTLSIFSDIDYANISDPQTGLLSLLDVAKWNRYYYHIGKAKVAYKRGEVYRSKAYQSGRKKQQAS